MTWVRRKQRTPGVKEERPGVGKKGAESGAEHGVMCSYLGFRKKALGTAQLL